MRPAVLPFRFFISLLHSPKTPGVITISMACVMPSEMAFFQVGLSDRTDVFQESVRGVRYRARSSRNLKGTYNLLHPTNQDGYFESQPFQKHNYAEYPTTRWWFLKPLNHNWWM